MWIYYMKEALRGLPEHRLPMPEGVVTARVSRMTGAPAGPDDPEAVFEYFLEGTAPGEVLSDSGQATPPVVTTPAPEEQIF
jgi:penicillin-binding protein 1A